MTTRFESTLPDGMRERAFAMKDSATGEAVLFGRGTDFPCSEYIFPATDHSGEMSNTHGRHAVIPGQMDIAADYFEASFGVTEPNAADKLDRLTRAWSMANYSRPSGGVHELYYVLGGRARMMYGIPSRMAPKYNGYKSSFHEGVLRFAVTSPFYYDATVRHVEPTLTTVDIGTGTTPVVNTVDFGNATEVPTPLSIRVISTAPSAGVRVMIEIYNEVGASFSWRTVWLTQGTTGEIKIENAPGRAVSNHRPSPITEANPVGSGADYFLPQTPPFRDIVIRPGDKKFRITANNLATSPSNRVHTVFSWRDCYAGA